MLVSLRRVPAALLLLVVPALGSDTAAVRAAIQAFIADLEGAAEGDEVVVTATAGKGKAFEVPYAVDTVDARTVERRSYRSLPQALREVPGVMVQETASGQGSPFLRGFTGFHNVFLIDGVRLNNSVFRPGPNQYWSTVDPLSLRGIEVMKGPASVLYGSDAIGGAVQALTKDPYAWDGDGWGFAGLGHVRFASAENSWILRGELSVAHGDTGALLGLTSKDMGDLVAGHGVGRQNETAYDEVDGDFKLEHLLDPDTRLVLAYQHVRQNEVPRTHSTIYGESFHGTSVGTDLQRDLDQERWLCYAQFSKENMEGAVEALRISLSWQSQAEVQDRQRTGNRRDKQGFDVGTLGAWVRAEVPTAWGRFTFGVEVYHDEVSSFSTSNPVQGPVADDATYDLLGAFLQDEVELAERWRVLWGARVTYAAADADSVSDPATGGAIALADHWTSVVGSFRALYEVEPEIWNLFGGVSQGFRAPNLSDLTRFDSARSNEFEVPAPGLDPEHYVSFEIGTKARPGAFSGQVAVFYTLIRDQIERFPTGNTNADGEFEVSKANLGDGYLYGIEMEGSWRVRGAWTVFGNATYLEGKVDTYATSAQIESREYVSKLMPLTALVGLRYEPEERWWIEGIVQMAAKADRLSPSDMADTQRIPPGGTPGYAVVHLRAGWNFDPRTRLVLGLENLFDKSYRIHGSGSNMPGFNVVASLTKDF
jgi:hemoglobin/transferrin/lactoferrin receptor protein